VAFALSRMGYNYSLVILAMFFMRLLAMVMAVCGLGCNLLYERLRT